MRRSGFFWAALVVMVLSLMLTPLFGVMASASQSEISEADIEFRVPPVFQVRVDHNYPSVGWPGGTGPQVAGPFSTDPRFHAPRGAVDRFGDEIPFVCLGLVTCPSVPAAPCICACECVISEGWVYANTQLFSISRTSRNAPARPWRVGETFSPAYTTGWPGDLNVVYTESQRGIFEFDGWNSAPDGSGFEITPFTFITDHTTLYAQWIPKRDIRIRHVFDGGPGPGASWFFTHELAGNGLRREIGTEIDLDIYATNLHLRFINFYFYVFQGWEIAVGNPSNTQPATYLGPNFRPRVFGQSFTIPYPSNMSNFASGRLYLIANWRVSPPDTSMYIPDPPPEGGGQGGQGGGGGGGQQVSPPPGPGVIGPGVGPGPGGEPPADELIPEDISVPETGGAPLLPIAVGFPTPPAVVPMPELPSPFVPVPVPGVPAILELPALAVPIVGLAGSTWALMNLILAVFGAVVTVATLAYVWLRKKNREEEGSIEWEANEETLKRRRQWLMVVGLVSLVSVVLFPLTQDMSRRMALLDVWTLAHVILLVGQLVAVWQVLRRKRVREDDEGFAQL